MRYAKVYDGKVRQVIEADDNAGAALSSLPQNSTYQIVPIENETVGVGYSFVNTREGGEFVAPSAPTPDELIAELEAQIKNLQKDK